MQARAFKSDPTLKIKIENAGNNIIDIDSPEDRDLSYFSSSESESDAPQNVNIMLSNFDQREVRQDPEQADFQPRRF